MSSKIEALPLPQKARSWLAGPLALFTALIMAAGVAGYFALRQSEPASRPTAAYENSGVITGTGPGLSDLVGKHAAYENSGLISGTGPGLAELANRLAAYRNSGLVSGTGPALAELRGVDAIGISTPSFPSSAAMERSIHPSSVPDNCRLVRHGPC